MGFSVLAPIPHFSVALSSLVSLIPVRQVFLFFVLQVSWRFLYSWSFVWILELVHQVPQKSKFLSDAKVSCSWLLKDKLYCNRSGKGNQRAWPELRCVCVPSVDLVPFALMSLQVRRGPQIRNWGTGKALTWQGGAVWRPWSPQCPRGPRWLSRMIRSSLRSSNNKRRLSNMASSCEYGCYSSRISWGLWQSHIFSRNLGLTPLGEGLLQKASADTRSQARLSQPDWESGRRRGSLRLEFNSFV